MAGNENSGRKTKAEEFEAVKEKIRQEALMELANKVVYKQLLVAEESGSHTAAKDFALPIALKGMTEKRETSSTIKVIDSAKEVIDKYGINTSTGGDSEEQSEVQGN